MQGVLQRCHRCLNRSAGLQRLRPTFARPVFLWEHRTVAPHLDRVERPKWAAFVDTSRRLHYAFEFAYDHFLC
jgi:hypothetical protein